MKKANNIWRLDDDRMKVYLTLSRHFDAIFGSVW